MNIQITGRQVDVTERLRKHIDEKFTKLQRHFDHITHIHVTLSEEKGQKNIKSEVNLSTGRLVAKSSEATMYAAIDSLIDKLDRQLIKHKEKLQSHDGNKFDFEDEMVES